MAIILSKTCKPDNFESYKSLKLSFMNIEAFVQILLIESLVGGSISKVPCITLWIFSLLS